MSQRPSESTAHSLAPTGVLPPSSATSLCQSLFVGSIGFCLVSTAVFATVAFGERWLYGHLGVALTYAFWTLLFVLGGGAVVARLNRGCQSLPRSYAMFALAFFLFAVGWTAAYFATKLAVRELLGVIVGTLLMGLTFLVASAAMKHFVRVVLVLLLTNAVGYFAGRVIWQTLGGKAGMILWGVLFGLGLGLGLGYTLYVCRASATAPPAKAA